MIRALCDWLEGGGIHLRDEPFRECLGVVPDALALGVGVLLHEQGAGIE